MAPPDASSRRARASFRGYRRRIRVTPGPDCVTAAVEDDFHLFRVTLRHCDGVVVEMATTAERYPWLTCAHAAGFIQERLVGARLDGIEHADDPRLHCTHLFDLAMVAAAHAGDAHQTVFEIAVTDPRDGKRQAMIARDGVSVLSWTLDEAVIVAPAAFAGENLRALSRWIGRLPPELREAARLLRRGAMVAGGRQIDLEVLPDAAALPEQRGACFSFQASRAATATRMKGAIRDFSPAPELLLAGETG